MIKRLLRFFEGYRIFAILCPLFMIAEVFCDVMIPRLMGMTINEGILQENISMVYKNGYLMIGLAFFGLVTGGLSSYFASKAGQGFGYNLRGAIYRKIQTFSFANLDEFDQSTLITRLTNDVTRLSNIARMTLRMAVRAPSMFLMAFIMALTISPRLSLIFAVAIPVLGIVLFLLMRKAFPRFRVFQKAIDRINHRVQENLTNIRNVKSFVREDFEIEKFKEDNENLYMRGIEALNVVMTLFPFMFLVMYSTIIAVLWFGGSLVISGDMLTGDLFSFVMFISQILMSLMMLSMLIMNYTRAKASAERVIEILNTRPDLVSPENGSKEIANGAFEFRDVSFRYPKAKVDSLSHVNLKVESGQTVAVVGSTGSSKSTLVQLLPRLYDVREGQVTVAGKDVKEYDLKYLRDKVAIVLQQNTLFTGTIRENLMWGDPEASDEKIWRMLEICQAADFIRAKEGLDSWVEQGGANYSGGQIGRAHV